MNLDPRHHYADQSNLYDTDQYVNKKYFLVFAFHINGMGEYRNCVDFSVLYC